MMSCICLGPKRSGKTHLLKALQDNDSIDETSYSTPTNGTSIYNIVFPTKSNGDEALRPKPPATDNENGKQQDTTNGRKPKALPPLKSIRILEIGGSMAPIWRQYFNDVKKLMYVVDTANLCQISAAGIAFYSICKEYIDKEVQNAYLDGKHDGRNSVLFYSILSEPRLQKVRILLVLSKMDYAYRQMRNEALLMLQMSKLQKEIRQNVTILEVSPVSKVGLDSIYNWLKIP